MPSSIQPHPRYRELFAQIRSVAQEWTREWSRPVYRAVELQWARPEFLISGQGTMRHGGRWIRPGVTAVVHAASTEHLALKESRRPFTHYAIKKPRKKPRVIVEIEVALQRIADLSMLEKSLSWPLLDELIGEDWDKINARGMETLAQALGRALFELDFEGLAAPSARDRRGRNLIWFPDNLRPASRLRIASETELKRWLIP